MFARTGLHDYIDTMLIRVSDSDIGIGMGGAAVPQKITRHLVIRPAVSSQWLYS